MNLSDEERVDAIRDLERQIQQHPGTAAHSRWTNLASMYRGVYRRNREDLVLLLKAPQNDSALAIELIQNVRPPEVREKYADELARLFLNYVAGTFALVDHVRRLLADYETTAFLKEFESRKRRALAASSHPVVQGLRNYYIHFDIPAFSWTLRFADSGEDDDFGHHLPVVSLLRWDGWSSSARAELEGQEEIDLTDLVLRHGQAIDELHEWLLAQFQVVHGADVDAVNTVISKLHASLAELDASRRDGALGGAPGQGRKQEPNDLGRT